MNVFKANQEILVARIAKQYNQDVLVKEGDADLMYACTFSEYDTLDLKRLITTKNGKLLAWGVKKTTKSLGLLIVFNFDWRNLEESVKGLLNINASSESDDLDFVMCALTNAPDVVIEDIVKFTRSGGYDDGIPAKELVSWLLMY